MATYFSFDFCTVYWYYNFLLKKLTIVYVMRAYDFLSDVDDYTEKLTSLFTSDTLFFISVLSEEGKEFSFFSDLWYLMLVEEEGLRH